MKLALAQMQMAPDIQENLLKSLSLMRDAKAKGADAICFPEIQLTPFFPQYAGKDMRHTALHAGHPMLEALQQEAKTLDIVAFPNVYWQETGEYYDATLVIERDGTLLGTAKMVHIAQCPQFYEQDYYTQAPDGFRVFNTSLGKIGIVVCFDRHYPESFRSCALQEADLVIIPTANITTEPLELFEWEIRIPAFQNSLFIAMCNRVGPEDAMHFAGESLIVNPDGKTLVKAAGTEKLLIMDMDLSYARTRRQQRPYFSLLRPEAYSVSKA